MKKLSVLLISLVVSNYGFSEGELTGKVTVVFDGNTFEMTAEDNDSYKIKLYGIDCPQIGQEFGEKAKKFLEKKILDKVVRVKIQGKDRWGTRLGIPIIEGLNDLRIELLEAGLAWTAERDPIQKLEAIREKAEEKGKGLWREQNPTPPWIYRRQQTMTQFKSS